MSETNDTPFLSPRIFLYIFSVKSVVPPVPERKVSLPVQLPPMAKAQQELIQELKQEVGVQLYNSYITSQECYEQPDYSLQCS